MNNNSTTNFIPVIPPSQENRNTRSPRTNRLNLDSNNTNQSQTNQNVVSFGGESLSREDYMHDDDIDRKYPHSHEIDHVIDEEDIKHNFECMICLEQFKNGEKSLKLRCSHIFHKECLAPWLKNHSTCPTCRQTINRNNPSIFPTSSFMLPNHSRQITIPFSVSSNRNRTFFGQSSLWSSRNPTNPQPNVPYRQQPNYNYQPSPRPNIRIFPPSQNERLVDGPCTYNRTHNSYIRQPFYNCVTCGLVNNLGCCEACAKICHQGHQLVFSGVTECFCDCGAGKTHSCVHCKCLKVPAQQTSTCTFVRTGKLMVKQNLYTCVTCHFRIDQCICESCAKVCHNGHDVRFIGKCEGYCDCGAGELPMRCKCMIGGPGQFSG